jgi:hypothetical protein
MPENLNLPPYMQQARRDYWKNMMARAKEAEDMGDHKRAQIYRDKANKPPWEKR